ncbi:hypothetical protein YDYSY3_42180 [Paenibacillus chitinolyticus]|uniref:agmatine deiminase family protein n=1 Tax=Paenibacillus chitinolyticus TaxID=79263 RepID=UPI0026E4AD3A|nr:agmatine deiminase family protein [Paenibacillus chitinolyticus]GKS13218.1 hypothetical protein YDYSY3_42180 [Paenibacillus chitinolyticus]
MGIEILRFIKSASSEGLRKALSGITTSKKYGWEAISTHSSTRTRNIVKEAGSKGSYLNFYIGNEVVLVPVYGDEHDSLGLQIMEGLFPGRRIVGINMRKLYAYGGMIHCVTQQHPK